MAKFNFTGKQQVVLEEQKTPKNITKSPKPLKKEKMPATHIIESKNKSDKPEIAVPRSSVLAEVTTKALAPLKLVESLTSILDRVEIGQLRGRGVKPIVVLGIAEHQALGEMLNLAQLKLEAFIEHKEARQSLKEARVLKAKSENKR